MLDEWADELCLIGGWAVYALTETFLREARNAPFRHRGSLDVDIALGSPALTPSKARDVAERLLGAGYVPPGEGQPPFRWYRSFGDDDSYPVDLMTSDPPGHDQGPVPVGQYQWGPFWNGEPALRSATPVLVRAVLPTGDSGEAVVRIASPSGLLFAKAQIPFAKTSEPNSKHLYDVYCLIRAYPGGPEALAERLRDDLAPEQLQDLVTSLLVSFESRNGMGPIAVADEFLEQGDVRERRLTDAQVTVSRLLRTLGD